MHHIKSVRTKSVLISFSFFTNKENSLVSTQSSPSSILKYLPLAIDKEEFIVDPYPPFSLSMRMKLSGYFFTYSLAMDTVESLDPSFTIITSMSSIISGEHNESRVSLKNLSTL